MGLQPWAKDELKRQKVQDLSSIITTTDNLIEIKAVTKKGYVLNFSKLRIRDKKENNKKKFGRGAASNFALNKGNVKPSNGQGKDDRPNLACFICNGSHFAREC